MSNDKNTPAWLYGSNGRKVARVVLKGFEVQPKGPLGGNCIMRTFHVIDGGINERSPRDLYVRARDGWHAIARIATYPNESGIGCLQFVS